MSSTLALPALERFSRFFLEEFEASAAEIEETDRIPASLLRQTAELGAYRLTVPVEHGGFGLAARDSSRLTF